MESGRDMGFSAQTWTMWHSLPSSNVHVGEALISVQIKASQVAAILYTHQWFSFTGQIPGVFETCLATGIGWAAVETTGAGQERERWMMDAQWIIERCWWLVAIEEEEPGMSSYSHLHSGDWLSSQEKRIGHPRHHLAVCQFSANVRHSKQFPDDYHCVICTVVLVDLCKQPLSFHGFCSFLFVCCLWHHSIPQWASGHFVWSFSLPHSTTPGSGTWVIEISFWQNRTATQKSHIAIAYSPGHLP